MIYLKSRYISLCFLLCIYFSPLKAQIVINEIMSSNSNTIADEDGHFEDWIELYNSSSTTINLQGYGISDKNSEPFRWVFPSVEIEAESFILIFASGKDRTSGPYLHTNFSIKAEGEALFLTNASGVRVDSYPATAIATNRSMGRRTDGELPLVIFTTPSPGFSNNNQAELIVYTDSILISHPQGFYKQNFYLRASTGNATNQIRYTTNGSLPTANSPIFNDSVYIYNRHSNDNTFSMIPTNPATAGIHFRWKPPSGKVYKGNVLRLQAFNNEQAVSPVYTLSYFVHPDIDKKYQLPVFSIVADSLSFFDYDTGIYVPGYHHDINPSWSWPWGTGNYHQRGDDWERFGNVTMFEKNGNLAFQQNLGIRTHGGGSRALPAKSLRFYARNQYGSSNIDYQLFPESNHTAYRRFIIRNAGQDYNTTLFTDALTHKLLENLDLEIQYSRPSVAFINGEFWGIYNIRDRIDKYYFEYCCNANPEAIDYLTNNMEVNEGSASDYESLIAYIEANDLSEEEHYNFVADRIDIANFIDYNIVKIYIAVYDWPGNNIDYWKKHEAGSKWRWVMYDNDRSLTDYKFNGLEHATKENGEAWPNPPWSTFLLRNLLKNDSFKIQFLERFEYHIAETFAPEKIEAQVDFFTSQMQFAIGEHISRWGFPLNLNTWQFHANRIREFAVKRPCYMLWHLIDFFDIDDTEYGENLCPKEVEDEIKREQFPPDNFNFTISPNPGNGFIEIKFRQDQISETDVYTIYDMKGSLMISNQVQLLENSSSMILNLSGLPNGIYWISITGNNEVKTKKLILID